MVRVCYGDNSETFDLGEIKTLSAGSIVKKIAQRDPGDEIYLTYLGNRLEPNKTLNELGDDLDQNAVLRIVCRETSPPSSLASAQQIEEIRKFFKEMQKDRNAYMLHTLTTAWFDPDFLRKQIESEPRLRNDGEALHVLADYFLLVSYFDENNKATIEWLMNHPILVSTVHKIIQQIGSMQRTPMNFPLQMPQMAPPINASMPNRRPHPPPLITPEQFQTAMMQAFGAGNLGSQPGQPQAPSTSVEPTISANPTQRYEVQLSQLHEFGFTDDEQNIGALVAAEGNVEMALEILVAMRENE